MSADHLNPSSRVLAEASIPENDENVVALYANYLVNTAPWRPSDAMRAAVRAYRAGGREAVTR